VKLCSGKYSINSAALWQVFKSSRVGQLPRVHENRYDIVASSQQKERRMRIKYISAALVLMGLSTASHAEGNAEQGAKVFKQCVACHSVDDMKNKVGPSLKGIVGRKAATVDGFKYSQGMLAKGAGGVVWDEATLTTYLPDPRGFVPGTKMAFNGVKKPDDVANLIAFLKTKL
jgi:cytochrome c